MQSMEVTYESERSYDTFPEAEGVEYIFGTRGEERIDLMDLIVRSTINFCSHGMSSLLLLWLACMVDRLGKPGVCLDTLDLGCF